MIHNTPEGNRLLQRALPLELLLQGLGLWLCWRLLGSAFLKSEWHTLLAAIGVSNSAKFLHHLIHRFYVEPRMDGFNFNSKASLLFINFCIGLSWGYTLYLLQPEPGVSAQNSSFAIACVVLLAGLLGSALWSAAFAVFAAGLLLPPIYAVTATKQWFLAAPWLGLLCTSIGLLYLSKQWQNLFNRYRQTSRQNSGLLQELARAREQAQRDHAEITKAHESLKQEMRQRADIEQQIRASENETERILQDMQDTYIRVDRGHMLKQASSSIHFMLGIPASEAQGLRFCDLFCDHAHYNKFILDLQRNAGLLQNHESQMRHRGGHNIWVSINAHYSSCEPTGLDGFEGTIRDITESKKAEEILFQEKNRLHVTLESIGDAVITTDTDGVVTYLNPAAESMTGWESERAYNRDISEVLQLVGEESRREVKLPLKTWIKEGKRGQLNDAVSLISKKAKREYTIELTGSPIRDSREHAIGYVIVFRNMTKLRALTKQLTYQASHDALTGLINRKEFDSRVGNALHSAKTENKTHALCYVDLDQFKIVNDTCGHHAGDLLLQQVTQMLLKKLRKSDTLARLGGDEFGVLLAGCKLSRAKELAESLREAVEKYRFNWGGRTFRIGASIGLVPIDNNTGSMDELLSSADAACYVAKENGRNRVHVLEIDDSAIQEQQNQMNLMQRIQRALELGHFELHAQKIVAVDQTGNSPCNVEILLRMRDEFKPGSLLPPGAFIPTAERYQLMTKIDQWVIENTFQMISEAGVPTSQWNSCAINVSAQSLNEPGFLQWITPLFKRYRIKPGQICFELQESAATDNLENSQRFIDQLGKFGCEFALDNFGSGLSSFSYIKELNVHMIKIDGDLIKGIAASEAGFAVIEAINNISHVMKLKTVAKHVEDKTSMKLLRKIGVDFAQGFAIEKPQPITLENQSRAS